MADEGEYPKTDGDVYYGKDANMSYYQAALAETMNQASVNITSADTTILAANSSRKGLILYNNGSNTIFIGKTGVTSSTGYPLYADDTLFLLNKEEIHGITASTTEDLRYIEVQ